VERATIQRIAEEFWASVGEPEPYPRLLEPAVLWVLPLAVFKLPRLWVGDVQGWLADRGIRFQLETSDRPLHGCLLAFGGRGCVLLNGADGPDELRFSMAHEVAHFLLDYHEPRLRAVNRLGPRILEVFDGYRPATVQERVHAVLSHVPVGFHTHLMDRQGNGVMGCDLTSDHEGGADHLALELLAPEMEVRRHVAAARRSSGHQNPAEVAELVLRKEFGLPSTVATGYAGLLYPTIRNLSVREWLRQRDGWPDKLSNFSTGQGIDH
jgi:hypothetical protein